MAKFRIVDAGTGAVVAGLDNITEQHSVFTTSRIVWKKSPLALAEHEGMDGHFKTERYRCLRLPSTTAGA